ncbi:MAG: plastocyanin, partial [Azonexus sp.]|nr:plastocyanin [Azonexus sp.]
FPQESWQRRFEKPGRYDYHCGPHPEMKGVVVVSE